MNPEFPKNTLIETVSTDPIEVPELITTIPGVDLEQPVVEPTNAAEAAQRVIDTLPPGYEAPVVTEPVLRAGEVSPIAPGAGKFGLGTEKTEMPPNPEKAPGYETPTQVG